MSLQPAPPPVLTMTGAAGPTDDRSQAVGGTAFDGSDLGVPLTGCEVSVAAGSQVLGTATVAADGTWSADVLLPALGENDLVASVTDPNGRTAASAVLGFDLETVLSPSSGNTGIGGTVRATVLVPRDGNVSAPEPNRTFVFLPHPGHAVIDGLGGAGDMHDTLSFSTKSFSSIVDILHHTTMSAVGATIHLDSADTVTLPGVTFRELRTRHGMLGLHG